jgi:hypothetical protein
MSIFHVGARRASGESDIPQPPSPHTVIVTRSCSSMASGVGVRWSVGGSEALASRETCDGLGGSLLAVPGWAGVGWAVLVSYRVGLCRVVSGRVVPGGVGRVESFSRSVEAAQRRTVNRESGWAGRYKQHSTAQHKQRQPDKRSPRFRFPPSALGPQHAGTATLRYPTQNRTAADAEPPQPNAPCRRLSTTEVPPCLVCHDAAQNAKSYKDPASSHAAPACTRTHTPGAGASRARPGRGLPR